jgi:predicted aldo/keto reductase-like oxidoreductase
VNPFSDRAIFETKHALLRTLMKTGHIRDAQQTKQCVYGAPCGCGRCYVGETVSSKNMIMKKGLHEEQKLAYMHMKKAAKYAGKK